MLDITFKTSLGHIASSLHELYSVLRLASFGPPKTKLPLITPARVQPFDVDVMLEGRGGTVLSRTD